MNCQDTGILITDLLYLANDTVENQSFLVQIKTSWFAHLVILELHLL